MICALAESLTPGEDGELRVTTSRKGKHYFFIVDPARPGRCAGGLHDADAGGWRFFHARYGCSADELQHLEQLEIIELGSDPLTTFADVFVRAAGS
ncbi:MAG TPA: hypothetical protein VG755_39745 [Nannocystaceae bacterium]|nr:hypothetical protein [Nannocystaceae bacterium]